jgi:hypothetical protein
MSDATKPAPKGLFGVRRRYPGAAVHSLRDRILLWRPVFDFDRSARSCVFLAGLARSGTTWLASVINYHNDFRHINEPFNPWRGGVSDAFLYGLYLRPDESADKYVLPARRLITGAQGFNYMTHHYNRRVFCTRRMIKEVRANLWLKWLHERFPEMPIALLLRHPIATVNSRMKRGNTNYFARLFDEPELIQDHLLPFRDEMERLRGASEFEQRIFSWCVDHYVPLRQCRPGDLHLAYYEHFSETPETEIDALFKYFGVAYGDDVLTFIKRPSAVTRKDAAIKTGKSVVALWREEIPAEDIAKALRILAFFGLDRVYGEGAMPDPKAAEAILASD